MFEQIPKTALDVFRMLPEGTLPEVIANALYILPTPKYGHQKIVGLFCRHIGNHLDKTNSGIAISHVDVYFEDLMSAVQPDVMYVSNENMHILHDDEYFYGAPDLIVEVLSSDENRDRIQKKNLYEKAGVKEYFIINPANRNVIAILCKAEVIKTYIKRMVSLNLPFWILNSLFKSIFLLHLSFH